MQSFIIWKSNYTILRTHLNWSFNLLLLGSTTSYCNPQLTHELQTKDWDVDTLKTLYFCSKNLIVCGWWNLRDLRGLYSWISELRTVHENCLFLGCMLCYWLRKWWEKGVLLFCVMWALGKVKLLWFRAESLMWGISEC
jgi:hypothetical protein